MQELDQIIKPPPERRVGIVISASANTMDDLINALDSIAERLMDVPESGTAISEGFGAFFSISDKGEEYTPEKFREDLDDWKSSRSR